MSPIRVISLARATARRETFARNNGHLPYRWFEAVDGGAMSQADFDRTGLFAPELARTYTAGAYACAMSHHALWREAADGAAPLTIAEDDAVFRRDFERRCDALLASLPTGWDCVLWGWNFDSYLWVSALPGVSPVAMAFDQQRLRDRIDAFQTLDEPVHPLRLDKAFGVPAYTLSPDGARKLLALCWPMKPLRVGFPLVARTMENVGIDMPMNAAYPLTASYACFPPLVATPNHREHPVAKMDPGSSPG